MESPSDHPTPQTTLEASPPESHMQVFDVHTELTTSSASSIPVHNVASQSLSASLLFSEPTSSLSSRIISETSASLTAVSMPSSQSDSSACIVSSPASLDSLLSRPETNASPHVAVPSEATCEHKDDITPTQIESRENKKTIPEDSTPVHVLHSESAQKIESSAALNSRPCEGKQSGSGCECHHEQEKVSEQTLSESRARIHEIKSDQERKQQEQATQSEVDCKQEQTTLSEKDCKHTPETTHETKADKKESTVVEEKGERQCRICWGSDDVITVCQCIGECADRELCLAHRHTPP